MQKSSVDDKRHKDRERLKKSQKEKSDIRKWEKNTEKEKHLPHVD